MNVFYDQTGIGFQDFSKTGDEDIQTAAGKEMIIPPDFYQQVFALDDLIHVFGEMQKEFVFPAGK